MSDKTEREFKLGRNNPEMYVLKHNRFYTYVVLIFSDLNEAQFYKMPYRDSSSHEIEKLVSSNNLNMFKPKEDTVDYHYGRPNEKFFLFETEDRKYNCVGEKSVSFEKSGKKGRVFLKGRIY